jgi:Tfp pilus assembly protein PilN
MIALNLLPPERRAVMAARRKLTATRRLALTLSLAAAIAAGAVLSGERLVESRVNRLTREASTAQAKLPADEAREFANAIKDINLKTRILAELLPQDIAWGQLVADLLTAVPPGVTVTRVAVSQVDRSISIDGTAATRADLLALKEAMVGAKFMETFDTTLSDLTKRENIDFPAVASHVPQATLAKYRRP